MHVAAGRRLVLWLLVSHDCRISLQAQFTGEPVLYPATTLDPCLVLSFCCCFVVFCVLFSSLVCVSCWLCLLLLFRLQAQLCWWARALSCWSGAGEVSASAVRVRAVTGHAGRLSNVLSTALSRRTWPGRNLVLSFVCLVSQLPLLPAHHVLWCSPSSAGELCSILHPDTHAGRWSQQRW